MKVRRQAAKGSSSKDGDGSGVHPPLHPALEAFAHAVAAILVERHGQRKRRELKEDGEASGEPPRDFDRSDDP